MKNANLLLLISFWSCVCAAQGVFTNKTNYTLEKVVADYPSQFKNIKGELLTSGPGFTEYKSTITIPGAVSATITESAIAHKQVFSWQSLIYSSAEFNTAKKKFEELFNQIKNTIIKPEGESPVIIDGQYNNPAENKASTSILFDLLPATGALQKINIDLMLKNAGGRWKIILSVYDKDHKETEGIAVK